MKSNTVFLLLLVLCISSNRNSAQGFFIGLTDYLSGIYDEYDDYESSEEDVAGPAIIITLDESTLYNLLVKLCGNLTETKPADTTNKENKPDTPPKSTDKAPDTPPKSTDKAPDTPPSDATPDKPKDDKAPDTPPSDTDPAKDADKPKDDKAPDTPPSDTDPAKDADKPPSDTKEGEAASS